MVSGLAAGNYTVTVSDAADASCTVTADYTITQPAETMTIAITSNNVLCNGGQGSASIAVSGGNAGTYHLTGAAGEQTDASSPIDVSNLAAGSYYVTVTDVKGCQASGTINITEPVALQFENCPGNYTATCESGADYAVVSTGIPTANHNIENNNSISLSVTYPDNTISTELPTDNHYPVGTTTVTYTLSNSSCNETVTCSFTVTVSDQGAPAMTCPGEVVVNCISDLPAAYASYPDTQ